MPEGRALGEDLQVPTKVELGVPQVDGGLAGGPVGAILRGATEIQADGQVPIHGEADGEAATEAHIIGLLLGRDGAGSKGVVVGRIGPTGEPPRRRYQVQA